MNVAEQLRWQRCGYQTYQRAPANLLIRIVLVPLFLAGNVGFFVALFEHATVPGIVSLIAIVVAVALQGLGHRRVEDPPEPFSRSINAVSPNFPEQWITLPRFVNSGKWLRALRQLRPL